MWSLFNCCPTLSHRPLPPCHGSAIPGGLGRPKSLRTQRTTLSCATPCWRHLRFTSVSCSHPIETPTTSRHVKTIARQLFYSDLPSPISPGRIVLPSFHFLFFFLSFFFV